MKLLKFYADWCQPCKNFAPTIEKVCNEKGIEVIAIDVGGDKQSDLAEKEHHRVTSIPTIILFDDGDPVANVIKRNTGQMTEKELNDWLTLT